MNPVIIPFGASHRVNFDTPPLQGTCRDTLVSRQLPLKTKERRAPRYLLRDRHKPHQKVDNG